MQSFSTLGSSKRQRQRQARLRVVRAMLALALVVGLGVVAYQTGRAQNAAVIDRLDGEVARLETAVRTVRGEATAAREQARAATDRAIAIAERYRRDVPQEERADLLALLDRRLADGLTVERLAFVLQNVQPREDCADTVETRRFLVTTPVAVTREATVSFGGNRIIVTGQGTPDRDDEGRPVGWFDVAQPVSIRFLKLDGAVSLAEGVLPLSHRVIDGDREWRFLIRPQTERGFVEVSGRTCAFP
ncbi:MAG: hypothetical protein EA356_15685 [Geminicoccaceae bacterium]|nr:MAG: hypothetical protein EA356_15685 [Geminicoccaceae bacterium]